MLARLAPLVLLAAPAAHAAPLPAPATPLSPAAPALQKDGGKDDTAARAAREARAKEAVKALTEGLRAKDPSERRAALTDASEIVHPKVVKAMAKALEDRDADVATHAVVLFGTMDHPDALSALRKYARRAKKALAKDPERHMVLLRSVGLHEEDDQVDWLLDGVFSEKERLVRRARIFSAARARSMTALEGIFDALGKQDLRRLTGTKEELRTALVYLTGTDQGESLQAWVRWWRENRKGFELPEKAPKLSGRMLEMWGGFWDEDRRTPRQRRRGDRG